MGAVPAGVGRDPALGGQDKLDLVLAALSEQTYPSHLMEAVVVDDGTEPPLTLPSTVPKGPGSCGPPRASGASRAR